jgi:predicted metal-binding protein
MAIHALYICKSCFVSPTQKEYMGEQGGRYLFKKVLKLAENWHFNSQFLIKEVDCLSACKRPCAIALEAPSKMSLMFGDLPPLESADAILKLCEKYYTSSDGVVPRQQRPNILQKGILARIPPPEDS